MSSSPALKSTALIAVTATATSLLIQACGGGAFAQSAGDADLIEGTWDSSITIKDCDSGATLNAFKGASLFHRGGTLSGDNSMPPPTRGAAFGLWSHGSSGLYSANLWFTRFNPDGTVAGTQKVKRSITLAANGNMFSGTLTLEILNPAGVVVAQGCGVESASRVTW
jgi:hypothetical protein